MTFRVCVFSFLFAGLWFGNELAMANDNGSDVGSDQRMQVLRGYADLILETGRDRWSGQNTPLFADGINVDSGEPVVWRFNGQEYMISNLASQQNLFRFLTGLSNLTGDETYKNAAKATIQYHFDHLVTASGLLQWGGHQFIDLATLQPANGPNGFDSNSHEFKNHFPFYELMWEVDEVATARFLRSLWNAHITDWSVLDMNRHGSWTASMGSLWDNEFSHPEPFFEGRGLTFINAGSDLIYAANMLFNFEEEQGALTWAKNLNGLYINARHPETGLGVYQYSKPERREDPPEEGPLTDTNSKFGDRAENQFGKVFGDVAREGWVLWGGRVKTIYVDNGFMQMAMAESLGEIGNEFLNGVTEGLKALAEHVYEPESNQFRPMWADGTDLTGQVYPRTGYYGEKGTEWRPVTADMDFLMTYARAYRLTGDKELWNVARSMAHGLDLGDIGSEPGQDVSLNMQALDNGYKEIFALLEIYRNAPHQDYLERAKFVADRIISQRLHNGFFLLSKDHIHARFDTPEPLAILALEAVLSGEPESVPAYMGGSGYIHGNYDGYGRTYDTNVIWPALRDKSDIPVLALSYPTDGVTVSPRNPEFSWEEITYAAEYQIQLTASNFSSSDNILLDTIVVGTSFTYMDDLDPYESYRWRGKALNEEGDGEWSSSALFYTSAPVNIFAGTEGAIPNEFSLDGNYPNPFNPVTNISYALPERALVSLKIYDITGRVVTELVREEQNAGYHSVVFDATHLSSGVYLYRLNANPIPNSGSGSYIQTRRFTLVK